MNDRMEFVDEKFYSADLKRRIFENFRKSILTGSLENMSNDAYCFYHTRLGFIAHFDIQGFRNEFAGPRFLIFVNEIANPPWYVRASMSDLEKACRELAARHLHRITEQTRIMVYNEKVQELKKLADELGYRVVAKDAAEVNEEVTFIPNFRSDGQALLF